MSESYSNPYNHQNAVRDPEYFIGRNDIIDKIEYDLGQAKSTRPQYRNIGITGKEGAGKSSLGYMIQSIASDLDLIPVHVKLNKNNAQDEVQLFKEIYGEITKELGGDPRSGYIDYLRGITDVEFNLQFLRVYYNTEKVLDSDVSESILREDFNRLYSECNSDSIVLILDNAQDIAKSEIILQKLRNIFSDIQGYNLILIGTEDTFSEISNAFSPVARMFDKFDLGPFKSVKQTEKCILKPLQEEERENVPDITIREIHSITSGRPYEINLLCDYMYRKRDGIGEEFQLTPDVLQSVIDQMETWRRPIDEDLINQIRTLSSTEFSLTLAAIECPEATKKWLIHYTILRDYENIRPGNIDSVKKEYEKAVDKLKEKGVISEDSSGISFSGSNYATAFLKYYGYANDFIDEFGGAAEGDPKASIANVHHRLIDDLLLGSINGCHAHCVPDHAPDGVVYHTTSTVPFGTSEQDEYEVTPLIDSGSLSDNTVVKLDRSSYFKETSVGLDQDDDHDYPPARTLHYRCNLLWTENGFQTQIHIDDEDKINKIEKKAKRLKSSLEDFGVELLLTNENELVQKANNKGSANPEEALELAEQAIDMNPSFSPAWYTKAVSLNNIGEKDPAMDAINKTLTLNRDFTDAYRYKSKLHLSQGEIESGKRALENAVQRIPNDPEIWAAACHNLGYYGFYEEAKEFAERGHENSGGNAHMNYHWAQAELHANNPLTTLSVIKKIERERYDRYGFSDEIMAIEAKCLTNLGYENSSLEVFQEFNVFDHLSDVELITVAILEYKHGTQKRSKEIVNHLNENGRVSKENLPNDSDIRIGENGNLHIPDGS